MAAVLAVFASTHEAAATVAVRQTRSTGIPVRGSTMWWSSIPPARQRRTSVLEVARPPEAIATTGPGPSSRAR